MVRHIRTDHFSMASHTKTRAVQVSDRMHDTNVLLPRGASATRCCTSSAFCRRAALVTRQPLNDGAWTALAAGCTADTGARVLRASRRFNSTGARLAGRERGRARSLLAPHVSRSAGVMRLDALICFVLKILVGGRLLGRNWACG